MKVIYAGEKIKDSHTALALGNFDGLHTAHMEIIRSCIAYAKENALKSGVMLFSENIKKGGLITSNALKLELLEQENPDFVYIKSFDDAFRQMSPEEFVRMLCNELNVKALCVGYDYRFGHHAKGDAKKLLELGKEYGIDILVTPKITEGTHAVHASHIKELIKKGDIENANKLLGRSFCVEGEVVHGLKNGTKMGIPTANVGHVPDMVLPQNGVYAGTAVVEGKEYKCVINVGKNPTFDAENVTVESHILDFSGDIYNKHIRVYFHKKLRDDMKFNGIEELKEQIQRDIKKVKEM